MTLTLRQLQQENDAWAARNFPNRQPVDPLLGIGEEVGELMHAFLKKKQGIRGTAEEHDAAMKDALADILIYMADFSNQNGIDLQSVLEEVWALVKQRDWEKNPQAGVTS